MSEVIKVDSITLKKGSNVILDDVSFAVRQGTICALIGNNGAGKTSLLKVITGLNTHYTGKVSLFGKYNHGYGSSRIGVVMDEVALSRNLSVKNYFHQMYISGGASNKTESELLEYVKLGEHKTKRINQLSLGMKQRLKIACALIGDADLLILDEPFNGLDPDGKIEMGQFLKQLSETGHTILVTSHEIEQLVQLADCFLVMNNGRLVSNMSLERLRSVFRNKCIVTVNNDTTAFINYIKSNHTDMICYSNQDNRVSVFGKASINSIYCACQAYGLSTFDVQEVRMTEKDVLLAYMEGINYD